MDDLLFSESGGETIAYMSATGVAVTMEPAKTPAAQPTTGTLYPINTMGGPLQIAYWGDDNNFPNDVKCDLVKDAEMLELLNFCVRSAYSKGIQCLNIIDWDQDGDPIYEAIKDWNIINFYRSDQIRNYCIDKFLDIFTFSNAWAEVIPTRDRSQIYSVGGNLEAMHCRWQMMGNDGKLKSIVHNKNWPYFRASDVLQTTILPAIDPNDFDIVNKVKKDKSLVKFAFPLRYKSIGQTYYQTANWNGLRLSGWMKIAAKIPEFKLAMMTNSMTIKYLVRIPNSYWPSVYKDWDKKKESEQTSLKKAKLKEINASLTDAKNAGKSILNEVGIDPITKEKIPGWEIVVIDDKSKPGAYLDDSTEVSSMKLRSLGINSALPGSINTGKSMNSGGSEMQLAWNISIATIDPYRELILDPLKFAAKFDDHIVSKYPGFTLKFRDSIMETVNGHNQTATGGTT